ncbi:MAG: histidine--tRNA ligase [Candidatus Limnocylindrales bacterium]
MPTFRAPRGTRDLLPGETPAWTRLERLAGDLRHATAIGGSRPRCSRGLRSSSAASAKSPTSWRRSCSGSHPAPTSPRPWALRPEPTAGIVRAYVQHGMHTWPQPVKVYEIGPMFRYDRPQAGRYRQFWQFDIEAIGDPGPAIDAEIVELGSRFYADAGLTGVAVLLNSIGDPACRPAYVERLTAYFREHDARLPAFERGRLERNVLRLLDSKDPAMAELNAAAPRLTDHLCSACEAHFAAVRAHLDALGVSYRLAPGLVRGLDYYTRTAFEYYVEGREGQQQALGAVGVTTAWWSGWAAGRRPGSDLGIGLDRLVLALGEQGATDAADAVAAPVVVVVGADPDDTVGRLRIATELRAAGVAARAELGQRKLGKQLESAAREGPISR